MSNCTMSEAQVNDAFLAAQPLIAREIQDMTVQYPNWLRDIVQAEPFPLGEGNSMDQLIYRGSMPAIERGLENWRKLSQVQGCDPCQPDGCGYNWTQFGGSAMERRKVELMTRDFRSPSYCVKDIQTTAHFKEVFAQNVKNLYRQVDYFKELNIGQNVMSLLSKKLIVDSDGIKPNPQNPYVYRNLGSARLSALNIDILAFLYEQMRRMPDTVPYDIVDGAPLFAMSCSHELLSRMYLDDPGLRQDARFSGFANDLVLKYNFMSTIRGMFIAAPVLYPRRFNVIAGEPIEVLPFVDGIPAEVGTFTSVNPAYMTATHEEVCLYGKYPFKIFFQPTAQSLGGGSDFGPEPTWFDNWQWINPQTQQDPFRRMGYFATSATFGISQQFSEGLLAILVERPTMRAIATFYPEPVCPPTPVVCNNSVPAAGCPCPVILSFSANPVVPGRYFFKFAVPVTGALGSPVQLGIDNGGYITGTLTALSADGYDAELDFADGVVLPECDRFTTVFCNNTLACSSNVLAASDCRSGATGHVELTLSNPIRAITAGDDILAYMGDGSTQTLQVVSVDMTQNLWVMEYAPGSGPTDDPTGAGATNLEDDMMCDRHGVLSVCVPPTTDASCPACGGPTVTQCS